MMKMKRKSTFQRHPWMMKYGLKRQYLKGTYVSIWPQGSYTSWITTNQQEYVPKQAAAYLQEYIPEQAAAYHWGYIPDLAATNPQEYVPEQAAAYPQEPIPKQATAYPQEPRFEAVTLEETLSTYSVTCLTSLTIPVKNLFKNSYWNPRYKIQTEIANTKIELLFQYIFYSLNINSLKSILSVVYYNNLSDLISTICS